MVVPQREVLLTPSVVAALLFVDPKTVTRWARAGKIDFIRTPGGHRRYPMSGVQAIMDGLHAHRQVVATEARADADHGPDLESGLALGSDDGAAAAAAAAVVSDAVAIALEAEARQAADAVILVSAAVSAAATQAARAAVKAQGARAVAADAAASAVAAAAARTAARVHTRADVAATQVAQAAKMAADALLQTIRPGDEGEAARTATMLADTVAATAQATAEDTAWAAASVARDVITAAAQMARRVAAEEALLEDEVQAAAIALRFVNDVAAGEMATKTQAKAAGFAFAAREAAAALP